MSYKKAFLLISICGLVIASLIVFYRRELKIPELSPRSSESRTETPVGCLIIARIGDRNLRMGFSMAAADRDQREDLLKKLPVIRHDLLMSANHPEFLSAGLELRDFDSLRDFLLTAINRHANNPVDDLFFDTYFFD